MATTPNFNWSTPDNTGLVKNGALDIRTLGNSIDSSMADLKGGTTGQVLTKASNTDMDFSWVADATGIPATIFDAKGDIIAATAADTASRLAVGTNGQVLTADSTAATGIKWATPAGGGKVLQVVSTTYSTATTVASTTLTDTGLSLSITPTSSSSKVLVIVSQACYCERDTNAAYLGIKLLRGATSVYDLSGTNAKGFGLIVVGATLSALSGNLAFSYLDSPATTSATTYKTQGRVESTANNGTSVFQNQSMTSSITLLEIGA